MNAILEFLKNMYSAFDTSKMEWFTAIPEWIIMDVIVLLLGVFTVGFILKHEEHPKSVLLEIFCFIFLYASIYENMAQVMGWYGFGKSLVMVFNVPITVPLIEALFTYASIRFASQLKIPKWGVVVLAGAFGVLGDLTLDPLALAQEHGGIGRWSWFIAQGDVNIFGAPVYNYMGWFLLCGYAATFILLGRRWHEKSGYNRVVGIVYPPVCFLGALAAMCSPISSFLLWLGPWFSKGGKIEYVMLGLSFAAFAVVLLLWRGRMKETWSVKSTAIFPVVFGVFYASNLLFDCIAGRFDILLFSLPWIVIHGGVYLWAYLAGKKKKRVPLHA
ncbi:MAG: hypothetical protein LBS96_04050 [Oscillospiraceae bacterium]|jgi:hypothetical protein|nr:hypothetical protein [Oscillospiraceae bacterium]